MLSGLNHLTLSVTDLNRSVGFYHDLLHLHLDATWDNGAYLSLPGLWLCLSLDPLRPCAPAGEYTHYAFSVAAADFFASGRASASRRCTGMAGQPQRGRLVLFSRSRRPQAGNSCR